MNSLKNALIVAGVVKNQKESVMGTESRRNLLIRLWGMHKDASGTCYKEQCQAIIAGIVAEIKAKDISSWPEIRSLLAACKEELESRTNCVARLYQENVHCETVNKALKHPVQRVIDHDGIDQDRFQNRLNRADEMAAAKKKAIKDREIEMAYRQAAE